ncbi:MAG: glucokinase [Desulfuromonas sp.]|nr:glucokinase [Desulfuromonas sp.]
MLILAGDIGGTTTRLAFFRSSDAGTETVAQETFPSHSHGTLAAIVQAFADSVKLTPERACFGIAGPVRGGRVLTPNLPWLVDGNELAALLGLARVTLINDLQANAYGIPQLEEKDFALLNPGEAEPTGAIAVISAGTGLGETAAVWDGTMHRPLPGEWGHADFAPRNELESELLLYLRAEHGRVSYERVLSGPGLVNIYRFLRDCRHLSETSAVIEAMEKGIPAAVISSAAMDGSCPLCIQALDLFVSLYGAEAGNLALRTLATGGVYLGGGIAPKIIEHLRRSAFMRAFTAKGRLSPLLETIPVRVILNEHTALLGAGRCAMLATT